MHQHTYAMQYMLVDLFCWLVSWVPDRLINYEQEIKQQ